VTILAFDGKLDAYSLPKVDEQMTALFDSGCRRLVLNLQLLKWINAAALGFLGKHEKRLRELGGELVLSEPSEFFQTAINTLRLDQIYKVFPNDAKAVKYFHDAGGERRPSDPGAAHPPEEEGPASP
jgi:anti-anti-sigma factor